jgi:hypothetical protein
MGPRARLDAVDKRNISFPCQESKCISTVQSAASLYTDWAVLAPINDSYNIQYLCLRNYVKKCVLGMTWLRSQARSCAICSGQSGTGQVFSEYFGFPLPILILPNALYSSIIRGRYNRAISLTPPQEIKKIRRVILLVLKLGLFNKFKCLELTPHKTHTVSVN